MSVAIIADSHLGGPGGDGDLFVEQLRALPGQGCTHLVLLGDIFHVWVGSRKFETPEVRKVVPELRALRDAGVRVDYVEGNRDFFLQRLALRRLLRRSRPRNRLRGGGAALPGGARRRTQ